MFMFSPDPVAPAIALPILPTDAPPARITLQFTHETTYSNSWDAEDDGIAAMNTADCQQIVSIFSGN
jgi:hypothetical protein